MFDNLVPPGCQHSPNTMASLSSRRLLTTINARSSPYICAQCRRYATPPTTDLPAPPLLFKLRGDLKTAMKAKDMNRLNVLRSLIADVTNSAKTNTPIKTNMQLLSLLKKRATAAKQAGEEFEAAGRQDLGAKEKEQAGVFEEYAEGVEMMSDNDVRDAVIRIVEDVKAKQPGGKLNMGDVLKQLLAPGGSLDGKPVERSEVAKIVKQVLSMS